MNAARRDRDREAPVGQNIPADHLDDLRAQLPAEFRDCPDGEIAQLWLAWDAARHKHPADHLVRTCAVSADTAARLVSLARDEAPRPHRD